MPEGLLQTEGIPVQKYIRGTGAFGTRDYSSRLIIRKEIGKREGCTKRIKNLGSKHVGFRDASDKESVLKTNKSNRTLLEVEQILQSRPKCCRGSVVS